MDASPWTVPSVESLPYSLSLLFSNVSVEPVRKGTRDLILGKEQRLAYELHGPPDAESGIIFLQGTGRSFTSLGHHARRLAAAQVACLLVDRSWLTDGGTFKEIWIDRSVRSAQCQAIRQAVDHARWMDKSRLAFVGHGAGGAIALEAAVALQEAGRPPTAVVLLDAVPWDETADAASRFDLAATSLVSIRSSPSVWNKQGGIKETLNSIPPGPRGRLVDFLIPGSRHKAHVEPSLLFKLTGTMRNGTQIIEEVMDAFLGEKLCIEMELTEDERSKRKGMQELLEELQSRGAIEMDEPLPVIRRDSFNCASPCA